MLTLFPRIRPNPPAPPPSLPATKDPPAPQSSKADHAAAASVETPTVAVIPDPVAVVSTVTAAQTAVTSAAVATAEISDAASASAAGTRILLATQELISADVVPRGHGSIDSQLISVFTEAFVASTSSGAAAQNVASQPFVVEITCVPAPLDATEAPVAPVQAEIAVAESRLPEAESPVVESAAGESVAATPSPEPVQIVEPLAATEPTGEPPATGAIPVPDVAQSKQFEQTVSPEIAPAAESAIVSDPEALPLQLSIASTTIFDELDILHEVAESNAAAAAEEQKQSVAEAQVALDAVIEATMATPEVSREQAVAEPLAEQLTRSAPPDAASQEVSAPSSEPVPEPITELVPESVPEPINVAAEMPISASQIEEAESQPEPPALNASPTQEPAPAEHPANAEASSASESNAGAQTDVVASSSETIAPEAPGAAEEAFPTVEVAEEVTSRAEEPVAPKPVAKHAAPRAIALPRKPPRSKASFFELQRIPEPEAMDDSEEVEAYSSAAAQAHLDAIDDTFVAHAQLLVNGRERGRALDIGTGPGQIVIKLGARLTRWKFAGIDRSAAMIEKAREGLADAPEVAGRIEFRIADGNSLDFPAGTFDLVICNSVLHHMAEPQKLFAEIARVVKPGGAILLRDLVRPPRFSYGSHIRKNAKHYQGEMKRLYVASVHAAYTEEELQKMVAASSLRDVRIFRHAKTHIGFERPLAKLALQK